MALGVRVIQIDEGDHVVAIAELAEKQEEGDSNKAGE
jgi:hypothetical protein